MRSTANDDLNRQAVRQGFEAVRARSEALVEGLSAEDMALQSMPDASPAKWHLAHTSWFFEALVLRAHEPGYEAFDERFFYLFNSYYEALGPRHPRPQRGLLSRPGVDEVRRYRHHVDGAVQRFIAGAGSAAWAAAAPLLRLGLHHEQQHQELLLTDIKHAFSLNPLQPAWRAAGDRCRSERLPLQWRGHAGGLVEIGHAGEAFAFDNETPRHRVFLSPYELASRPVSCGEYLDFIRDGGYRQPMLWLSDGWAAVQSQGWLAPAYWALAADGTPTGELFTLHGPQPLDPAAPACHLSAYEAAAFAAWAGARLPTEFELEHAAAAEPTAAVRDDFGWMQPLQAAGTAVAPEVWQWTSSSYAPYPGFRPLAGPAAEYNGKFMINQLVLRGGSCATPPGHWRSSYRNFFPPAARWQFTGLRLARDAR
ncbi:ergothioneine biosynthesis protein EgtB [Aquabacterium sp.]|uniref:ergothioneine biosynthesis protein EgtB n=1 Tax=Aquabacterium sp. TaxID=1872578 RepID=UPI003784400A